MRNVEPVIHVPDVRAAAEWYESIGFTLVATNEPDGVMDWAKLTFGVGSVMFMEGGEPSAAFRRDVDLYVTVDDIDRVYEQLKDRVEIVEGPHDTFYGMREFIIRDVHRFWITFGHRLPADAHGGRGASRIAP